MAAGPAFVKLERVRGLRKPAAERLRRGGVRTVEDLALLDLRARRVKGFQPAELAELRKRAQKTIFQETLRRVRRIADEAFEAVEGAIQDATWAAVDAAKVAQARAGDAVRAARGQARVVASVAAAKTREAARKAEREYLRVSRQLRRTPPAGRTKLRPYEVRARRARTAAQKASAAAVEAVRLANSRWRTELKSAQKRSHSLVERIRASLAADHGRGRHG